VARIFSGPLVCGTPPGTIGAALTHLALAVHDQERSRRFYETYLGFDAEPPRRYDDGVLMLYNARGFALALGEVEGPIQLPLSSISGFGLRARARCAAFVTA
jgi:catechol 2,3-dioxygenase-like lactoylglutathione lyase family enzyme